jgi:hypothetical protein
MVEAGNRLIEAQRHEVLAGKRYDKRRTKEDLKEWKAARLRIEPLVSEYLAAIREWRESIGLGQNSMKARK